MGLQSLTRSPVERTILITLADIPGPWAYAPFYIKQRREIDMKSRVFFGIVLVIVGALLLLMTLDMIPIDGIGELVLYIPSLFILWGFLLLVTRRFKRAGGPITMIAIASVVQLMALDVLRWEYVWPIVIILIGAALLGGGFDYRRRRRKREKSRHHGVSHDAGSGIGDDLNISVMMGEANERSHSRQFRGGKVACTMGTLKLDLTQAEITDPPARINIGVTMGDVTISVPDHWIVQNDVASTLAEITEHTECPEADRMNDRLHDGAALVLNGSVLMGNLTIESAPPAQRD